MFSKGIFPPMHQRSSLYGKKLTISQKSLVFTCLQCKPFENAAGKGEIARNVQFLLFHSNFYFVLENFLPLSSNLKVDRICGVWLSLCVCSRLASVCVCLFASAHVKGSECSRLRLCASRVPNACACTSRVPNACVCVRLRLSARVGRLVSRLCASMCVCVRLSHVGRLVSRRSSCLTSPRVCVRLFTSRVPNACVCVYVRLCLCASVCVGRRASVVLSRVCPC